MSQKITKDKSYLTAMSRASMSTPTRYLLKSKLLHGAILDYGCGKGDDARILGALYHMRLEMYDTHYAPNIPASKFDIIICNYVLNTIENPDSRDNVISHMYSLLKKGGIAYITVRNDKRNLNGNTKRGTWQGIINLALPIIATTSNFKMYKMEKGN